MNDLRNILRYARSSPRRGLTLLMILMGPLNLIYEVIPYQMALLSFVVGWYLFLTERREEEEESGVSEETIDFLEPAEFHHPFDRDDDSE